MKNLREKILHLFTVAHVSMLLSFVKQVEIMFIFQGRKNLVKSYTLMYKLN